MGDEIINASAVKKEKKIFGIGMKILIVFVVIATVVAGAIGMATKAYNDKHTIKPISVPSSGLSTSVFSQQNNEYRTYDSMPLQYNFGTVNFSVDVPELAYASIGNSTIFRDQDNARYDYVSETTVDNVTNSIKNEVGVAINSSATADTTTVEDIYSTKGFLNGYEMVYLVNRIVVTLPNTVYTYYMISYVIPVSTDNRCIILGSVFNHKNSKYASVNAKFVKDWTYTLRERQQAKEEQTV